jgi:hypothetical protein
MVELNSSVIAVADRLRVDTSVTAHHPHFRAVRPKHVKAFKLAP